MAYKDSETFLANGGRIDPLSEIRNAGIVTSGQVYWVKAPTDSGYVTLKDQVGASLLGDTANAALAKTVSDRNDYVLVAPQDANAAFALGTAIDITKNRVHLLGVSYNKHTAGYKPVMRGYVAASGIDTEIMAVQGAGVEIAGLKFQGTAGTAAGGTTTAIVRLGTSSSGTPHGFFMHDAVIENTNTTAPGGTAPSLVSSGDVAGGIEGYRFERVTFNSPSWAPAILVNLAVSGTAGPTNAVFEDCLFVAHAQATTDAHLNLGTGATNFTVVQNSVFFNTNEGTLPASAVIGALLADNPLLLRNNAGIGISQQGTDTQAYKTPVASGTAATVRDLGLGVGTAALLGS